MEKKKTVGKNQRNYIKCYALFTSNNALTSNNASVFTQFYYTFHINVINNWGNLV